MMTSPKLIFYATCLFFGKMAQMNVLTQSTTFHQDTGFISANVGENVTLKCFYGSNDAKYYWFKQTLGQKPQLIAVILNKGKSVTWHGEFEENPRFTLKTEASVIHLKISDLQLSDSATYYCGRGETFEFEFEFADGQTISVNSSGLNIQAQVHQSVSETIQPGGSVTLNCSVYTGTCAGQHSIYWFKSSEESNPGLIYTQGDRNNQCEGKPDTQTQSCMYNLAMKSQNRLKSDAENHYCAVASCGHMLFGNRTKQEFKDEGESLVMVCFLSGALTFTTILSILLAFIVYKMKMRKNCQYSESHGRSSAPSTNAEGYQQADIHYAALNVKPPNRPRRQRDNTRTECVYAGVRQ